MHEDIKTFSLDGEIGDSNLIEGKERLINFLEVSMRDCGAVPVLDIEPQFTLDYQPDKETYKFMLTLYGVHVGEEAAWETAGLMSGRKIMKHIQKPK
jgi:hypothetical protein